MQMKKYDVLTRRQDFWGSTPNGVGIGGPLMPDPSIVGRLSSYRTNEAYMQLGVSALQGKSYCEEKNQPA